MSYQVLARKWRPQTFAEVAGQKHVLKALSNALDQGRLHHAYLLTGTRGVGKTTIARILARCFNCEQGVSATPCGQCATCVEIAEGRSVDLIEVDAASRTKVEDTRELLENVQYMPTHARYKIYLIDEVHMLSHSSFNALLKTLEEPPPHVVFLFATTHPQKMPATVLSRCLQFHLKNLTPEIIGQQLQTIFDAENFAYDEAGIQALAHAAAGSMRDALSLADQAIGFGGGNVTGAAVNEMLGTVNTEVVVKLLAAIAGGDGRQALALIDEFGDNAGDFPALLDDMLQLLHRVAVEQAVPGAGAEGQLQREFIAAFAGQVSPQDIQFYYQALLNGKRDLPYAPDPVSGAEMTVIRMLAFQLEPVQLQAGNAADKDLAVEKKTARPEPVNSAADDAAIGETRAAKKKPVDAAPDVENRGGTRAEVSEASVESGVKNSVELENNENNTPGNTADYRPTDQAVTASASAQSRENNTPPSLQALDAAEWCRIFSSVPLSGVVRTVASYCIPRSVDEQQVVFTLEEENATLYSEEQNDRLAKGLSIYYGQPLKVSIVVEAAPAGDMPETPADYRRRLKQEAHSEALSSLENDDNVKAILETFGGEIDVTSVKPLASGDDTGATVATGNSGELNREVNR